MWKNWLKISTWSLPQKQNVAVVHHVSPALKSSSAHCHRSLHRHSSSNESKWLWWSSDLCCGSAISCHLRFWVKCLNNFLDFCISGKWFTHADPVTILRLVYEEKPKKVLTHQPFFYVDTAKWWHFNMVSTCLSTYWDIPIQWTIYIQVLCCWICTI